MPKEFENKKMELVRLLIQIRNCIAHADYKRLERKVEEYIEQFMIEYNFDYYEYSRNNWAFLNMNCILNEVVAEIIDSYLENKQLMFDRRNGVLEIER
ncbi:hypothetical protein ACRS6Y_17235 [Bacillus cytotoxicus]|uniref:hypothetical protein n=1 Tax=Bacillus cereus group TaxID=86661 RepID=UPI001AEEDC5B|nr:MULTISPECIES: hypothetical protein [Bacillus cereus group]QTR72086.1 hypothetical protein JC775_05805 [Bacillus cytotoxicus]QTR77221.1 hypothetical protein JC773_11535 [Bacillus cytotoxicus]HDR4570974.1 hypothetical protein [Bacillus cytotoxicus]HDR4586786.1 hypothetical protein [Bacillus cytotoxicus]